jgi:hypothetical protein
MGESLKHRHHVKPQSLHAFGPEDLDRMQAIFDELCLQDAVSSFSGAECDALAKAVVTAYKPAMDDDKLRVAALLAYDAPALSKNPR